MMLPRLLLLIIVSTGLATSAPARQNRVDVVTPLAPELAAYGKYDIGVRTLQVTDRNRPDVLNTREGEAPPRYDRTLTLEAWYPASLGSGQHAGGDYRAITRDPSVTATLHGKAVRDAAPLTSAGVFPLILASHGYPGNRYLLSHLCENLASKGFVVVSIDHKDSTYDDQQRFASTLYNRPLDQLFAIDEIARLSQAQGTFLTGLVDAERTGLVGYSMGGYGVLNVIGAGYSRASETLEAAPPNRMLAERGDSNADYVKSMDRRIKAAIAIAPWGMPAGFWSAEGLQHVKTPLMLVAGSNDDVAGYEKGAKAIYNGVVNADRYLLTFVNAGHNAAAPIPAPAETYAYSEKLKSFPFLHYADPVWDTVRMNNILDHFATAYFDIYLKGDQNEIAYLQPTGTAKEDRNAPERPVAAGPPDPGLKGFKPHTAVGLILEHAPAGK
jgi:predicted dienelactone hydrolase